jgi:GntR family transcriptional regulator
VADEAGEGLAQPKNRAVEIAEALEDSIRAGELPAGSLMPGEMALAERFGAARSTVRRALGLLEDKGTVVRQPGKARMVRDCGSNGSVSLIID